MQKQFHGQRIALSPYVIGTTGKINKNSDLNLSSYTKINLKWISNLNVKCKILLPSVGKKKKHRRNYLRLRYRQSVLRLDTKDRFIIGIIDKQEFIKMKTFALQKTVKS